MKPSHKEHNEPKEDPRYLQTQIITYIGNKRSLLPFIGKGVESVKKRLGKKRLASLDLFSGSGIVARYLKQHSDLIIANDLEQYSKICNQCYLANRSAVDMDELVETADLLRKKTSSKLAPGFVTELYAPQDEARISAADRCFYTRANAIFLDTARREIAALPSRLQVFFLAPLLVRASVHANTSGVFKGFYKNADGIGQFGGSGRNALARITGGIDIDLPVFSRFECESLVLQSDANKIVAEISEVDLAYLDPPYNQHPYGSNYFMLNLLASYERPAETSRVSGIPTNWNRSRYNQRAAAADALFSAVDACPAKYIIISYNSEGFISREIFIDGLKTRGKVTVLETPYNTFRGSRNLRARKIHVTEFLYLLEKR